jgi:hypothetical protein
MTLQDCCYWCDHKEVLLDKTKWCNLHQQIVHITGLCADYHIDYTKGIREAKDALQGLRG